MYAILDALAAGSGCLHDIAYGGTGNDTNADDGDDTDQVADSVGTDDCIADSVHSCE